MEIADILEHNRIFLAGSGYPAGEERAEWALVSCMDPRLVGLIPEATGLRPGMAYLIQNAGNTITERDQTVVRSVAAAVVLGSARRVMVIGHTDCRMQSDVLPVTKALDERGIKRADIPGDIREAFGLIGGVEENVRTVLRALASSPLVPRDVPLYGLVIDTRTGALRLVGKREAADVLREVETRAETTPEAGRKPPEALAAVPKALEEVVTRDDILKAIQAAEIKKRRSAAVAGSVRNKLRRPSRRTPGRRNVP